MITLFFFCVWVRGLITIFTLCLGHILLDLHKVRLCDVVFECTINIVLVFYIIYTLDYHLLVTYQLTAAIIGKGLCYSSMQIVLLTLSDDSVIYS